MPILASSLQEIARQFPPSDATLQLLDLSTDAEVRAFLALQRTDIDIHATELSATSRVYDAILAVNLSLSESQLLQLRQYLRQGGRIILFNQSYNDPQKAADELTNAGFERVLAERLEDGILYRGEQPYIGTLSTLERVSVVAKEFNDAKIISNTDVEKVKSRFLFVLIRQTPNLPTWRMTTDTEIQWSMVAIETTQYPILVLAFTSLPKAVAWMQQAILDGFLAEVHKIAKFSKTTVSTWQFPLLLNSKFEEVCQLATSVQLIDIDRHTAEASDE